MASASSARDKFDAAVKVIRGLPANGPFQPSHDLMLKFYSYYKQATEGPCSLPKPGFWDIVNKKKWEAWMKLGNMEPERAMLLYVDELKKVSNHVRETHYPPKIVETMPQTEEVNVFLHKLDTFYEMVEETPDNHNNNVKDTDVLAHIPNGDLNSLTGKDESDFNHSENLSLLIKQDMKNAQEASGILVSPDRHNGDHASYNGDHSKGVHINGDIKKDYENGEEDDNDDEEGEDDTEDDLEEEEEEEVIRSVASEKFTVISAKSLSGEEREDNGREEDSDVRDRTTEWSDESETENEEFCDTSDELAIQATAPSSSPRPSSSSDRQNPIPTSSSYIPHSSSTPLPASKTVRINSARVSTSLSPLRTHNNNDGQRLISDSLVVNVSGIGGVEQQHQQEQALMNSSTNRSLFSGLDSSLYSDGVVEAETNCRGGEVEEGRDHKRKGGGHNSRGSARGGGRASGGSGGSGPSGDDGHEGGARRPHSNSGGGGSRGPSSNLDDARGDLNEQIVVTLLRLQRDMSGVLNRLHSLEALVKEGRREKERKQLNKHWWWPFPDLSFKTGLMVILWPIVLQMVLRYLARRRRKFLK